MKLRWALLAAAAVGLAAGQAGASIPSPGDTPPSWDGPAKVCGEAFAVDLAAGDSASAGWPSVGRIPYSVQTGRGRVDIVELWDTGLPDVGYDSEDVSGGALYPLPRPSGHAVNTTAGTTEFLFKPADPKDLPVVVIFYGSGWDDGSAAALLGRIDFGRHARTGCAKPRAS